MNPLEAANKPTPRADPVPLRESVRVWLYVAATSFGGPAAQIATLSRVLVEEKRWISQERFLHALSYCTLLPGPEAQQLATYLGWLLNGPRGAFIAGWLFVLPSYLSILLLSFLYLRYGQTPALEGVFFGLKCAVLSIVLEALLRVARRALVSNPARALALTSFAALFFLGLPFPLLILGAGLLGYFAPLAFSNTLKNSALLEQTETLIPDSSLHTVHPSWRYFLSVLVIGLTLWWLPVGFAALLEQRTLVQLGVFFGQTAAVAFGGAYALLAYVAQRAVEVYGWLSPLEMVDGLGLAETTPGPLIGVVQFVGALAAFRSSGGLNPWWAAFLGSTLTCWVTFAPSFLWIFLGAPFVETLRQNTRLSSALAAITASVVGVILNLSVWFALHVLFARVDTLRLGLFQLEQPSSPLLWAWVLALLAGVLLLRSRWNLGWVLGLSAALGAGLSALGWI